MTEAYKPITSSEGTKTVIGEPIIVRKLGENEYRDSQSIPVPESGTEATKPMSPITEVKKKPTKLDERGGDSVLEEADIPPTMEEGVDNSQLDKLDESRASDVVIPPASISKESIQRSWRLTAATRRISTRGRSNRAGVSTWMTSRSMPRNERHRRGD